jgi:phospholipase/carboxylesterase
MTDLSVEFIYCTSIRYNHGMSTPESQLVEANDPLVEAAGLIYRVRRGRPHGPLVILLHGLGGDESVMWIFGRTIPYRATVISPRAPIEIEPNTPYAEDVDGGYTWFKPSPLTQPDRSTFAASIDQLRRLVAAAIEAYQADHSQVYLMGFSQGTAMGYALSLAMPDQIAGVIALAGFMPKGAEIPRWSDPEKRGVPKNGYLILHGLRDERVPIEYARQARSALQALGAKIEYHEYPIGHKISPPGLRDIAAWLRENLK